MLTIRLNEQTVETTEGTTLFELRDRMKPDADVVIFNGATMNDDVPLQTGDAVSLIQRGQIPSEHELEALMAARHTPGVHAKLKAASVGIAGLGGLGSAVAVALARVGVGKLILADFDLVEPSNLNRQQYFVDQIGQLKTEALASNLRKINPYVTVEAHAVKLTSGNLFPPGTQSREAGVITTATERSEVAMFGNVDVMIEAFDRADQKAMLLQAFISARPDVPFIGASGMAGYASGETIGIKKLGDNVYIVGDLETGAQPGCGLMAPRVGIAASMQANLALRLIAES